MQGIRQETQAKIKFIVGKRGYGKTTLSKLLSQEGQRVIIVDPLDEYDDCIKCERIGDLVDYVTHHNYFRVSLLDDKKAEFVFDIAWIIEDCLVVVEEVDLICNPSYIGEKFGNCLKRGRHKNISVIASSRRPAEVNRLLSAMAHDVYIFRLSEPRDIKYISEYTQSNVSEMVSSLELMEFIHFPSMSAGKIVNFNQITMGVKHD